MLTAISSHNLPAWAVVPRHVRRRQAILVDGGEVEHVPSVNEVRLLRAELRRDDGLDQQIGEPPRRDFVLQAPLRRRIEIGHSVLQQPLPVE
jgi:hypothetical protein